MYTNIIKKLAIELSKPAKLKNSRYFLNTPRTSLIIRKKLLELGWEVMPHPSYSPDLAPFDYLSFSPFTPKKFEWKKIRFKCGLSKMS